MKQIFKNLLFFILNIFNKDLDGRASILMYHSIGKHNAFFTVTERNFKKQLEYLKRKKFNIVRLSDLIKKIENKEDVNNCICLTFDDGYKDNYDIVFPLIKKHFIPITIFLITDFIDKKRREADMLRRTDIQEMAASGLVDFMPHTQNHCLLDSIDFEKACREIDNSRNYLEEIMHNKADILAYPKGRFNENIVNYLRNKNWLGAVTVKEGTVDKNCDPFRLNRNSIDSTTTFIQFKGKPSKAIDKYNKIKKWLKF